MIQKISIIFCVCLLSFCTFSQDNKVTYILKEIEKNNIELKTFKAYIESQSLKLKNTNLLPNLEISAYYLPFGQTVSGNYLEFQLSQSFEFPTVYSNRRELIELQNDQLEIEYLQKRQQIFTEVSLLIIEVIALNKQEEVEVNREKKAEQLFSQIQTLFNKEQIGILELNKAKIGFMNSQYKVQNIQVKKEGLLKKIRKLNGGNDIQITLLDYETDYSLSEKDSIWQKIQQNNQTLAYYNQSINIAEQNVNLVKAKLLPNFSIGYNYQGFLGDNYSGIFAGVSLPLWGNKLRKNAAVSALDYTKLNTDAQTQILKFNFEIQYDKYIALLKMYEDYNATIKSIESEELLYKAYNKGHISFLQYFNELEFYYSSQNVILDIEKQLQLLKTKILNFEK